MFYGGVVVMVGHIALAGTLYHKGDACADGGFRLLCRWINLGEHGCDVPNPLPRSALARTVVIPVAGLVVIGVTVALGLVTLANPSQVTTTTTTTGVIIVASVGYYDADREVAYFGILAVVPVAVGVVVFAIAPWIGRQMEGVHRGQIGRLRPCRAAAPYAWSSSRRVPPDPIANAGSR